LPWESRQSAEAAEIAEEVFETEAVEATDEDTTAPVVSATSWHIPEVTTVEDEDVEDELFESDVVETDVVESDAVETDVVDTESVDGETEDTTPPSVPWEAWQAPEAAEVEEEAVDDGVATLAVAPPAEASGRTGDDDSSEGVSFSDSVGIFTLPAIQGESEHMHAAPEATAAEDRTGILTPPSVPWESWEVGEARAIEVAPEQLTPQAVLPNPWQPEESTTGDGPVSSPEESSATAPLPPSDDTGDPFGASGVRQYSDLEDALFGGPAEGLDLPHGVPDSMRESEQVSSCSGSAEAPHPGSAFGPSSSEIDDLIQEAVASSHVQHQSNPLHTASAFSTINETAGGPMRGVPESILEPQEGVPSSITEGSQFVASEQSEMQPEGEESLPRATVSEDFFIRPVSSRKGRE